MTAGVAGSRTTCNNTSKLVSLTLSVFDDGADSGKAEENAHSSSSATGTGAGADAGGLGFAKSKIDGDCCGVACRGAFNAANGSTIGACCFARAAACCC